MPLFSIFFFYFIFLKWVSIINLNDLLSCACTDFIKRIYRGTWMAQLVGIQLLILTQVMISQSVVKSALCWALHWACSLLEILLLPLLLCHVCAHTLSLSKREFTNSVIGGGAWVAQSVSVQLLISAQVMISQFLGSSPASGSVLAVWSLFLDSLSPSDPPLLAHVFYLK